MTAHEWPALISPDRLASHLAGHPGDPTILIIDIRYDGDGAASFASGHVPGAVHSDYRRDGWRRSEEGVPGLLPTADHLATLFGRLGLTPQRHVVVMSAGGTASDFAATARVYWTLKMAGHTRVSVLDGGFAAWSGDATRPVETGRTVPAPVADDPVRFDPRLRTELDAALAAQAAGSGVFLDARNPASFVGAEKSPDARRAGRIPGAQPLDAASLFDTATGRLKPVADLEAAIAHLPQGPVISYCNTGHSAALTWFVLSEVLGRPDVSLFDGSMSQWTQDDARPVATG